MNVARNIQPITPDAMTTFLQQVMNVAQDPNTVWNLELKPDSSEQCPDCMAALFKAVASGFSILLVTAATSRDGFCEAVITADDFCGGPAIIKLPDELAVQLRTHVLALMPQSN